MKIVIDTNVVSPHVVPLALSLADIYGKNNVRYVHRTNPSDTFRSKEYYGKIAPIAVDARDDVSIARNLAASADVLIENIRDFDMMETRAKAGKPTFYVSERWFKPMRVDAVSNMERASGRGVTIPGFVKMMAPFAYRRCRRFWKLLKEKNKLFYLPNGIYAARDMARVCGLMSRDVGCIFRAPQLRFDRKPGGRIWLDNNGTNADYCLDKMRMWGYFVEKGNPQSQIYNDNLKKPKRILWVGRMFGWKRIDDLIKAVGGIENLNLDLYGDGPELKLLVRLASRYSNIQFHSSVLASKVREVMRTHDTYVLSSNAFEGWGAVVNEALEEGMRVIGTYEAGSCATILPDSNLYHSGDWCRLRDMLKSPIPYVDIELWTAKSAARTMADMIEEVLR